MARLSRLELTALIAPGVLVVTVLLVIPVLNLLRFSFYDPGTTEIAGEARLANYAALISDPYILGIIARTLLVSLAVTGLCLVAGLPIANLIWKAPARWKGALTIMVFSPLLVSVVVSSFGWVVLLGTKGVINNLLVGLGLVATPLPLLYTDFSLILGLTHVLLPFMVLSLVAVLEKIDPLLTESAATLGAPAHLIWWHVHLPLALPGIAAGTTIVFALAMSSYVTPAVLGPNGPNFITTLIYQYFVNLYDWGTGATLSVALLIISTAVVALYTTFLSRLIFRSARMS
jgi:putative spermidine/putrescine transport system permease protein